MQEEQINQLEWRCRYAPSLGPLEDTPLNIWGIDKYEPTDPLHSWNPVVFFGLYGLPDFYALWRHKGKKAILPFLEKWTIIRSATSGVNAQSFILV